MNLLQVYVNSNNELLFGNKMQNSLLQFEMICSIWTIYIRARGSEKKNQYYKTVHIIEKEIDHVKRDRPKEINPHQ